MRQLRVFLVFLAVWLFTIVYYSPGITVLGFMVAVILAVASDTSRGEGNPGTPAEKPDLSLTTNILSAGWFITMLAVNLSDRPWVQMLVLVLFGLASLSLLALKMALNICSKLL